MVILALIVCLLAGGLVTLMHISYRADIRQMREDWADSCNQQLQEEFHRGWNEGVTSERAIWLSREKSNSTTQIIPRIDEALTAVDIRRYMH